MDVNETTKIIRRNIENWCYLLKVSINQYWMLCRGNWRYPLPVKARFVILQSSSGEMSWD